MSMEEFRAFYVRQLLSRLCYIPNGRKLPVLRIFHPPTRARITDAYTRP